MIKGVAYKIAYQMSRHYVLGHSLARWAVLLSGLGLGWAIWRYLDSPIWALAGAGLAGLAVWLLLRQARRRRYIRFFPQAETEAPVVASTALSLGQRVPVRATGHFEVSNMRRYFVEAAAQFEAFETRERVVMVNVRPSQVLLLARSAAREIGWWYTFFQPWMVSGVELGHLEFGSSRRPALKIGVQVDQGADPEELFLSFDDERSRAVVLADLQVDAGAFQADGR